MAGWLAMVDSHLECSTAGWGGGVAVTVID